jgi:hypothetical protein
MEECWRFAELQMPLLDKGETKPFLSEKTYYLKKYNDRR